MKKMLKNVLLVCLLLIACVCAFTSCDERPSWLPQFHVEVIDPAVAPTCNKSGLTEGSHCSICGEVFRMQKNVPPTENHTPVKDAAIAPTCTSGGLMEGSHCQVCGFIIKERMIIPAAGHNFVTYDGETFCNRCLVKQTDYLSSDGLSYTLNSDGQSYSVSGVESYKGSDLVIPSTYSGLPVTSISNSAFYNCYHLKSVTIPKSVTKIGSWAFASCDNLAIITIPNSVTEIGDFAFHYCPNLKNVYLAGTDTNWKYNISIGTNNLSLKNATIYYYSETKPTTTGNFWHYVDDVATAW